MRSASKLFASDTPLYLVRGNHEYRGNDAIKYLDYYQTPTGKTYYSVSYGKYFFLFLDSGEDKVMSDVRNLDIMIADSYVEEEAKWLKQVVESDEYKNAAIRIAFCHMPPGENGWHGNYMVSKHFVPLLNEAGLDLMLCAHNHRYKLVKPGTTNANFPVLINANLERLDCHLDDKGISIKIFDTDGAVTHSVNFGK